MFKKKVIFAGSIGGTIEFYDFVLYGACASLFAPLFFPASEPFFSLLGAYAVFGIGFFVRPLGSVLFGLIGDKYGRRTALYGSLLLMSIATLSIGLLPDYQKIGIFAPILMLLSRVLQGISAGGEYSGALIFAIEHNPKKHAGFVGSCVAASCMFGLVLGSVASVICHLPGVPDWSWRAAFIIGFFVSFLGIYIRYQLEETPDFIAHKKKEKAAGEKPDFWKTVKGSSRELTAVVVLSGFNGIALYVYFVFLAPFLSEFVGLSMVMSKIYICLGTMVIMVCLVLFGWLSDLLGRIKLMFSGAIGLITATLIMFMFLEEQSHHAILLYQMFFVICFAMYSAPLNTFVIELFNTSVRYRFAAIGYSLGMGVIGGSAPFIAKILSLSQKNTLFLALYIIISGVLAILALFTLRAKWNNSTQMDDANAQMILT